MMGVSQALVDLSGEMPTLVTFRKEQIALRHWGRYTLVSLLLTIMYCLSGVWSGDVWGSVCGVCVVCVCVCVCS